MKTKAFRNVNYIGWIVIILVFLFIYFSYFFMYIPRKEALLEQKAFRILKEYGNNMIDKNRYYENHFKNYGLFYSIQYFKDENVISKKTEIDIKNTNLFNDIEGVLRGLLPYVNCIIAHPDSIINDTINNKYLMDNTLFLSYGYRKTEETNIDSLIKLCYKSHPENKIDSLLKNSFINQVPINNFMENLKFDELFEKISFFDESNVYYNSKSDNIYDITNPKALNDTLDKTQGGIHKKINIRGQDIHVLILPFNFRGKENFIAGFISDSEFRHKTRNFNTQIIIYIASLLLLVFIGMPVLKIIFIDPRERLKSVDAIGSGISFMFGLGLLTIITISFLKTQIADPIVNLKRLDYNSAILLNNVKTDIDSIKKLGNLIGKKTGYHIPGSIPQTKNIKTDLSERVIEHFNSSKRFFQVDTLNYPFQLNEIILIDPSGILQKAYSRSYFSEVVKFDLHEREYFKNIWQINNSWPADSGLNFFIQSIKSYNSGEFETAISFRTNQYDNLPVLAITSAIPSLYRQVLPGDIEFLIINKNGNVLYHSKSDKNLHENFIQECDTDPRLLNAIEGKLTRNFNIDYDEKQWLAKIQPLEDTPLFHVTLLDLNQGRNENASIFLFTFFFFLVSFIFLSANFLILSLIVHPNDEHHKHLWILNWIIFQPSKLNIYKILTMILLAISLLQILGFYITEIPEKNLVYQLILIFDVLFITVLMLNDSKNKSFNISQIIRNIPGLILFIISLVLILFYLYIHKLLFGALLIAVFPLIISILLLIKFDILKEEEIPEEEIKLIPETKLRTNYLGFLMTWLVIIAVIPVVLYYLSFKEQEIHHRVNDRKLEIAQKNIDLVSDSKNFNSDWFKRIQGNRIDGMRISYTPLTDKQFKDFKLANSEKNKHKFESSALHDLVFSIIKKYDPINIKNYSNFEVSDSTLYFKQGRSAGSITVSYPGKYQSLTDFWYILIIVLISGIVLTLVWYLLKYISVVILNLKQEQPFTSNLSWFEIIMNGKHKRILLNSFDGNCFYTETKKKSGEDKFLKKNIQAAQLISPDYDLKKIIKESGEIIWISDFRPVIFEPDLHETLISRITTLNKNTDKTLVLNMSFDIGLINEFYDEYTSNADLKPEELNKIFLLKKKWNILLSEFFKFNGYLQQNGSEKIKMSRIEDGFKNPGQLADQDMQFPEIWSNLTYYERIVLHDLADDGLVNRKDNYMIKKLINKRLINPYPNPEIFSNEFRKFVLQNMKSSDIKLIEKKLGLKGRWHNARYLILLIILPLAAFIFISQGLSLEKIFGIFGAGIAAVTGLIRLFDGSLFKSGS